MGLIRTISERKINTGNGFIYGLLSELYPYIDGQTSYNNDNTNDNGR